MSTQVLKLNKAGLPTEWINVESAATLVAKDLVCWSMGAVFNTLRGGFQRDGKRSVIEIPTILSVHGKIKEQNVPRINNASLFARDGFMCLYCGLSFRRIDLSRDHILPRSRGGADTWENCVTACRRCNHAKDSRTPEEAGMPLLAVPYAPNLNEWFALSNRSVLVDQMDYLRSGFKHLDA